MSRRRKNFANDLPKHQPRQQKPVNRGEEKAKIVESPIGRIAFIRNKVKNVDDPCPDLAHPCLCIDVDDKFAYFISGTSTKSMDVFNENYFILYRNTENNIVNDTSFSCNVIRMKRNKFELYLLNSKFGKIDKESLNDIKAACGEYKIINSDIING